MFVCNEISLKNGQVSLVYLFLNFNWIWKDSWYDNLYNTIFIKRFYT